jgi:YVTN family beta-propeller protein
VIDVKTGTVIGSPIPVGTAPAGIVITPDGKKAYTLNGPNTSVIDTKTNLVTGTISVGNPQNGFPAVTPDGQYVYVPVPNASNPTSQPGTIVLISTDTDTVVGTPITVGLDPVVVAIAPDEKRAYVSNFTGGTVWVIAIDK